MADIPVTKNSERELAVPTDWRRGFYSIVEYLCFETALPPDKHIRVLHPPESWRVETLEYVADYGETLSTLPEETWNTSVVIWMESYWEVLVDLYTEESGLSDMVLHARVYPENSGYRIDPGLVCVP